jgi:hypothetical protein
MPIERKQARGRLRSARRFGGVQQSFKKAEHGELDPPKLPQYVALQNVTKTIPAQQAQYHGGEATDAVRPQKRAF